MTLLSHMKISIRIYVGFGIILGLLALVSWAGVGALDGIGQKMEKYERITGNAMRVAKLSSLVAEVRRNVTRYSFKGDDRSLLRIREARAVLGPLLEEAIETSTVPERQERLQKLKGMYETYLFLFDQVPPLYEGRTKQFAALVDYGAQMQEKLGEIIRNASSSGDMESVVIGGQAQEALMAMQLSALRFVSYGGDKQENKTEEEASYARFVRQAERLKARPIGPGSQKQMDEILSLGRDYEKGFANVVTLTTDMNELVFVKLFDLGATFRVLSNETLKLQEEALEVVRKVAISEIAQARENTLGLSLFSFLAGMVFAYIIGRSITRPVVRMTGAMGCLAAGDLSVEVPSLEDRDEIGAMAKAVEIFKENAIENERLQAENEAQKKRAEQERKAAMREMADAFESQVGGVIETVTSAAVELQEAAGQMATSAAQTSAEATTVAGAAGQSANNVQAVASASEELSASIHEITSQVDRTKQVAVKANGEADETTRLVQALSDDVGGIGEIVSMINDIAAQTNLLALNATIEAARAGEAGKGFAVVAGEVKNLANQTAKATEEVSARIAKIQNGTAGAVKAISSIAGVISEMGQISGAVASSIEQQRLATSEISRNVEQAAAGTEEVSSSISRVEAASREAGSAAQQISEASNELSIQASRLKDEVSQFLDMVRSDEEQLKLLVWDESLSLDKGRLDEHHKNIIGQINKFFSRMMAGEGQKGALEMIDTLGRTLERHFTDEEGLMQLHRYPDLKAHHDAHQKGWEQYLALRQKLERGEEGAAQKVLEFAAFWLKTHIGEQDRRLADYLRTRDKAS